MDTTSSGLVPQPKHGGGTPKHGETETVRSQDITVFGLGLKVRHPGSGTIKGLPRIVGRVYWPLDNGERLVVVLGLNST